MFYRRRDDWIRYVIRGKVTDAKRDLTHVERLVAVYIAEAINPASGRWIVSQQRISEDLGVTIRVVRNAVTKLRNMGLITTERVMVPGHTKRFNAYVFVPVELAEPL